MCIFGGAADNGAAAARAAEAARQSRISEGAVNINSTFNDQFTPDFFQGVEDSYIQHAMPDFEHQRDEAKRQLALALSSTGNLQSSEAGRRKSDLTRMIQEAEVRIAEQARGHSTQRQSEVETARGQLLSQNTASADPSAASNNSANRMNVLNQMPVFDPLGALFEGVTEGLATQRDLEQRRKSRYSIFNTGTSSGGSGKLYS